MKLAPPSERAGAVVSLEHFIADSEPPAHTEIPEYADAEGIEVIEPATPPPATLITPAQWPNEAPPPVDWLADHRIPRGDVTTLHGDGGAGKTDITLPACRRHRPRRAILARA